MRRTLLFATAIVLFTCTSAFADGGSVNYTGNVSFVGDDPGFSFAFSEPATIPNPTNAQPVVTTTTVDITQGPLKLVLPNSQVEFWDTDNMGLFDLDFTYLGTFYDLGLFGAQSYSTSGTSINLLAGNFPSTAGYILVDGVQVDTVSSANVTATATAPEPAGLALLGLGIAALLMLRKKQFGSAAI
jgi:PEP-CTERM motif-containing protein